MYAYIPMRSVKPEPTDTVSLFYNQATGGMVAILGMPYYAKNMEVGDFAHFKHTQSFRKTELQLEAKEVAVSEITTRAIWTLK